MSWLRRILPVFGLVLALLAGGCKGRQTLVEEGIATQTLRRGIGPELGHLDPHLATEIGHYNVLSALLEGLVSEDPRDLTPVPGVAERWDISDDGLNYVFHLRRDARWSNGDPVTAEDFVATFRRLLTPALAAENAEHLYIFAGAQAYHRGATTDFSTVGIKAETPTRLRLTLDHPEPGFLGRLNHVAFFPLHLASIAAVGPIDQRSTAWSKTGSFVGNGPFVLEAVASGQEIVVRKSSNYWDAATVRLERIHFVYTPERDAEERAYRAGQLHLTEALPVAKVEAWRRDHPEQLRVDPYLGTEFYRLNLSQPFLKDARVRRALNLATDRTLLVEKVLRGGQTPAGAFTPPGLAGYAVTAPLQYQPDEARRLLAEAGYPGGTGAPFVELLYNTSESHRAVAEALQSMWKRELGLSVKLINQERQVTLAARRSGDYQMLRSVWIADYADPLSFLQLWESGSANNFTGWSHPEYDRALREARQARDPAERRRLLQAAEERLLAEPPFVVLYHYTHVFLLHPSVKGWYPTLLDHHPYKHVYLER